MTQVLFTLTFAVAVPFWALMIILPRWRWTERIIASPLIVAGPVVIYIVLLVKIFPQVWQAVSAPDLPVLQALFATPVGAAVVWAHLIAFDLFVGRWIYLDGRRLGLSPLLVGPVLVLTIFLAPVGFAAYLGARSIGPLRTDRHPASPLLDASTGQHPTTR